MIGRRRIRYIGEPEMPLSDRYPRGVTFIGRWAPTTSGPVEEAVDGTGFLVGVPGPGQVHLYVVTAAHVVAGVDHSFVRMRTRLDRRMRAVGDLRVPRWFFHPDKSKDVAVAPLSLPLDHDMDWTVLEDFIDDPSWREDHWLQQGGPELLLGDRVYFIGLLSGIDAMREGLIPVVRAGTLARRLQKGCPVWDARKRETRHITAHLIDCRSFGGFSGSPCYFQQSRAGWIPDPDLPGGGGIGEKSWTGLLGMIGGHYDAWKEIESGGQANPYLRSTVNTGVGYVIPAEYIREALNVKELSEMRSDSDRAKAASSERGATMDTAHSEESEYARFEDLTKKLVQVPKPELDAERKKDEGLS